MVLAVRLSHSGAVEVEAEPLPFDSIPVPDYPEARRGRLVAVSAGSVDISGSWPGRAAICDSLGILQILAEEPGRGTLILLQMPEGNRATTWRSRSSPAAVLLPSSTR